MNIRYASGRAVEAVLLSKTRDAMVILTRGAEDAEDLRQVHGTWIDQNCEPVRIEYSWGRPQPPVTEGDCICSKELAAHLIHLLYAGDDEVESAHIPDESNGAVYAQPAIDDLERPPAQL